MKLPRPRYTISAALILIACLAGGFGAWRAVWRASVARAERASVQAELNRQRDRVAWATQMKQKGYVSAGQLAGDRERLAQLEAEAQRLGVGP